jgi:hypothetical protein
MFDPRRSGHEIKHAVSAKSRTRIRFPYDFDAQFSQDGNVDGAELGVLGPHVDGRNAGFSPEERDEVEEDDELEDGDGDVVIGVRCFGVEAERSEAHGDGFFDLPAIGGFARYESVVQSVALRVCGPEGLIVLDGVEELAFVFRRIVVMHEVLFTSEICSRSCCRRGFRDVERVLAHLAVAPFCGSEHAAQYFGEMNTVGGE